MKYIFTLSYIFIIGTNFLFPNLFNYGKVISSQKNNTHINETTNNDIVLPNFITCDSNLLFAEKMIRTNHSLLPFEVFSITNNQFICIGSMNQNLGRVESFVMSMDQYGNTLWMKKIGIDHFSEADDEEAFLKYAVLGDSSVVILGTRRNEEISYLRSQSFILKIGFNGEIKWLKYLPTDHRPRYHISDIIFANDSLYMCGEYEDNSEPNFDSRRKSFIIQADQNANIKKVMSYGIENQGVFFRSFSTGDFTTISSSFDNYQLENNYRERRGLLLLKIDSQLNVLQSKKITLTDDSLQMRYSYRNLFTDGDDLLLPAPINQYPNNSALNNYSALLKFDQDFQVTNSTIYKDTFILGSQVITDFVTLPNDNYLCSFGTQSTSDHNVSYRSSQIDQVSGQVIKTTAIAQPGTGRPAIFSKNYTNHLAISPIVDTTNNLRELFFLHQNSFDLEETCHSFDEEMISEDLPIEVESISLNIDTIHLELEDLFLPVKTIYPITKDLCCSNLPDADLQFIHPAYLCGDSIGINFSICNTGYSDLPLDFPMSFYQNDPCTTTNSLIFSCQTGVNIPSDSCISITKNILNNNLDSIYLLLGDPGINLPLNLICDFPLTNITECEYSNNLRGFEIPDNIRIPTFQDDYYLPCPRASDAINIIVPSYLSNPIWNNSFSTDTLTVSKAGIYILSAITPCGDLFTDTVEVVSPYEYAPLPFRDTTLCVGDSILLSVVPHEITVWSFPNTSGYTSTCTFNCDPNTVVFTEPGVFFANPAIKLGGGCFIRDTISITILDVPPITQFDTLICPGSSILFNDQTFTLTTDTLLSFSYPFSEFCDSTIQYQVTILDTSYQAITLTACTGDSVLFQNTQIAAGDNQTFVNTKTNGCDSTIFVSVQTLEASPVTEIFLDFCTGDSILIFDDYQQLSGIYSNNFTNINGCDSLVQITLTESPVFQTEDLIEICSGASVLVHGQSESQAGFYEAIFTAQNGCDSISFIELELFATATLNADITASCPDETNGEISLTITEGDGPFFFDWSDGNTADSIRQDLATGSYTLTLTDANGCTSIHGYNVPIITEEDCGSRWYAPNAFSPNDDGRNDRFTFYANARMDRIELLEIFDRRGSLVFRGENLPFDEEAMGWDGYLKGQLMNPQVFVWRAVVVDGDGKRESASGDVTLMR